MECRKQKISFSYFFTERFLNRKNLFFTKKWRKNPKKSTIILNEKKTEKNHTKLRLHEIADKLNDLLTFRKSPESILEENYIEKLESTTNIAIIFSKLLSKNQMTVEFERRISTILTQIKHRNFKPDIIAFIGGPDNQGELSGATAGYIYFRHISEQSNVDLKGFEFLIEESTNNTKENLESLIKILKRKFGEEALSKCHFTLISSDYHLIRIAEIYKLSRKQSLLTPLYKSGASWTYLFAAYPFCLSPDPTIAFLGRVRVLANDLAIVLTDLNGYVEFNDFIAKENFARLCETSKKLRIMLRIMSEPNMFLKSSFKAVEIPFHQWEVLERGLCTIHEVQVILTPLMNGKSVEKRALVKARDLLMNAIKNIRLTVDPDRPLSHEGWSNSYRISKDLMKIRIDQVEISNGCEGVNQERDSPFIKKKKILM